MVRMRYEIIVLRQQTLPLVKYDQKELTTLDLIAALIIYKTNCAALTSIFTGSYLQLFHLYKNEVLEYSIFTNDF